MSDRVTCLVVDDLDENRLALTALLRRSDIEVRQARFGHEAPERLRVHDVALAWLDVQMPGMDGFVAMPGHVGSGGGRAEFRDRLTRVPVPASAP